MCEAEQTAGIGKGNLGVAKPALKRWAFPLISNGMFDQRRPMRPTFRLTAFRLTAMCITVLALNACSRMPSDPPVPQIGPTPTEVAPATGPASDRSVPAADSVLTPAAENRPDPAAGRTNRAMTRAQESTAMPMPGQNNDHSAPLTPAKPASGP